jgi:hypothetical protein
MNGWLSKFGYGDLFSRRNPQNCFTVYNKFTTVALQLDVGVIFERPASIVAMIVRFQ